MNCAVVECLFMLGAAIFMAGMGVFVFVFAWNIWRTK